MSISEATQDAGLLRRALSRFDNETRVRLTARIHFAITSEEAKQYAKFSPRSPSHRWVNSATLAGWPVVVVGYDPDPDMKDLDTSG